MFVQTKSTSALDIQRNHILNSLALIELGSEPLRFNVTLENQHSMSCTGYMSYGTVQIQAQLSTTEVLFKISVFCTCEGSNQCCSEFEREVSYVPEHRMCDIYEALKEVVHASKQAVNDCLFGDIEIPF